MPLLPLIKSTCSSRWKTWFNMPRPDTQASTHRRTHIARPHTGSSVLPWRVHAYQARTMSSIERARVSPVRGAATVTPVPPSVQSAVGPMRTHKSASHMRAEAPEWCHMMWCTLGDNARASLNLHGHTAPQTCPRRWPQGEVRAHLELEVETCVWSRVCCPRSVAITGEARVRTP